MNADTNTPTPHPSNLHLAQQVLAWWEHAQFLTTGERGERNVFESEPVFVETARRLVESQGNRTIGKKPMSRHNASMDWFGSDGASEIRIPSFVDFDGIEIKVTYDYKGKNYSYSGVDLTGHGHYSLQLDQAIGYGSLYGVLPQDQAGVTEVVPAKLEGSFVEDGYPGMWRLTINPEPL